MQAAQSSQGRPVPIPTQGHTASLCSAPDPPDQAHVTLHVFNSGNPRQKQEGNLISSTRSTVSLTQQVCKAGGSCFLEPCSAHQWLMLCQTREGPRTRTSHALLWHWGVLGVRRSCAQEKLLLITVLGLRVHLCYSCPHRKGNVRKWDSEPDCFEKEKVF